MKRGIVINLRLTLTMAMMCFPCMYGIRIDTSEIPSGSLNNGKCRMVINEINLLPNGVNQFVELRKVCDLNFKPTHQFSVNMKFYKLLFMSHDGNLLCTCNLNGQAKPNGKLKDIFFTIGDETTGPDYKISDCHLPEEDRNDGQRLPIGEKAPVGLALVYNPTQSAISGIDLLTDINGGFTRTKIDSRLQKKIVENLMDFYILTSSSPYTYCQYFQEYYGGYNLQSKSVLRDWAQLDDFTERSLSRCSDQTKPLPTITDYQPFQPALFVYAAPSRGAENLCSTATPFVIEDYQPQRKVPRWDFSEGFQCIISTEDPAIEQLQMISSPSIYYQKLKELIRLKGNVVPHDDPSSQTNIQDTTQSEILGDVSELGRSEMPFSKIKLRESEFEEKFAKLEPLIWENCDAFQPMGLVSELRAMKNPPIDPKDLLDNGTCFWLEWLPTKAMRCRLCNLLLQQGVIKDRPGSSKITKIMTTGQINKGPQAKTLNRGIIRRHLENPLHLQAVEFAKLFQSGYRGKELYQQFHAPGGMVRAFTNATENLFATAYTLAAVDLPFYRFPRIWELLVYLKTSIGHLYATPTGLKTIQMAISHTMHADLVKYLKDETPEFSILIDSSTDVASLPALAIVIQTLDSAKNVKLYLYKVIWISGRETGQNLWDHFIAEFKKDGLDQYLREKCVGFASDGGSNVLAFREILKSYTDHGNRMIMVHCHAHKSELVIKNAWKNQEFALSVEDTVNVLHRIFESKSAKKKRHLQLTQEEVGDPAFSIKRIQKTRWVNSRLRALDKVILHWHTIVKALRRVIEDKTIKDARQRKLAQDTLDNLKNPVFLITTAFVADVYTAMSTMSLKLQDRGSTLIGKKEKRERLKTTLIEIKSKNGPFVQSILDQTRYSSPKFAGQPMTIENFETGYVILGNTALNKPDPSILQDSLSKQRENYVDLILQQLESYFPTDPTDDLDILDPCQWPVASLESYGNDNITSMNRQLKWNYDENELLMSWKSLKTSIASHPEFHKKKSSLNPEQFWSYFLTQDSVMWSNGIRQIITNVITIPASTAEVERVFSYYTKTKTYSRYSLDVSTVGALIRIRFNGPRILNEFDTFRYVWEFLDEHSRADDTCISAHRVHGSKTGHPDDSQYSSQAEVVTRLSSEDNDDILRMHTDEDMEISTCEPTASSASSTPDEYIPDEDTHVDDDDLFDYDVSQIFDDIVVQATQNGEV